MEFERIDGRIVAHQRPVFNECQGVENSVEWALLNVTWATTLARRVVGSRQGSGSQEHRELVPEAPRAK
ncbi:MAG: hypothetical protein U0800_27495 [Isosphaeraceae bacterium]